MTESSDPSSDPANERSRAARDLNWSITSPPMVAGGGEFPADDWFAQQITGSAQIAAPPARFRLGIHFEKIFQTWLEAHPTFQLKAANLQIQGQDRTLGEFDLLVEVDGELEHWELAVKFYINVAQPEDPAQWFGPDPNDTFAGKIHRLQTHQLRLGELEPAKALLAERGLHIERTRCLVKGRLYHTWGSDVDAVPKLANPNHLRGWWLGSDNIAPLESQRVAYIDKRYWLSAVTQEDQPQLLAFKEIDQFLAESTQIAPQFALLDKQGNELSRGFILKPEWFTRAGIKP